MSRNNDPPSAVNDVVTAIPGQTITIDVRANDSDPDNDFLKVIGLEQGPTKGTAFFRTENIIAPDGFIHATAVTYTPFATATGTDSFVYEISDSVTSGEAFPAGTDRATVTITIVNADGTPTAPVIEETPTAPVIEETLIPGVGPLTGFDDVRVAGPSGNILDIDTSAILGGVRIDLNDTTNQLVTFNGSSFGGTVTGFENVDVSGYNSIFGSSIDGTSNANTIIATRNIDALNGNSGNDTITGGGGNDIISGGQGTDTAVFTGSRDQYSVRESGKTVILTDSQSGRDGSDTLATIENYEFSDGIFQLADIINPVDVDRGIYRFFNVDTGTHFLSGSPIERDSIINNLDAFNFEGPTFRAADSNNEAAASVFRFFNTNSGTHFFTQSIAERDAVLNNLPNFNFEGEAYKGYTEEVEGSIPLYRFFNTQTGTHFYTAAEAEKNNIIDTLPSFDFEGIAYYVDPYIDFGGL